MKSAENPSGSSPNSEAPSRLAIKRDGIDLVRLIPGRMDNGKLDLKIVFPDREFEIYTYPLLRVNPDVYIVPESLDKSITYHHGEHGKDVVVHIKKEHCADGENRYTSLPLDRIMPPNSGSLVPFPLLKIELPRTIESITPKKRKKRKGKTEFDMDSTCNCLEVFMTPGETPLSVMESKLPWISNVLLVLPFECWSSMSMRLGESKRAAIPHKEPRVCFAEIALGCVNLLILQYPEPTMPLPEKRMRVTFLENELAEAIMLHAQCVQMPHADSVLTGLPDIDQIRFPDFMQIGKKRCHGLWLDGIRRGTVSQLDYYLLHQRVDQGRIELVKTVVAHRKGHERALADMEDTLNVLKQELDQALPKATSHNITRQLWLARRLHLFPTLLHVTKIANESIGVFEDYAFLTVADDIDVHCDIDRLCELSNSSKRPMAISTEGRPFSEGLGGLRTLLRISGYVCFDTATYLLSEQDDLESEQYEPELLYTSPDLASLYRGADEERKRKLISEVDRESSEFLTALDSGVSHESGWFIWDIKRDEPVLENAPARVSHRDCGRIGEDEWRALVEKIGGIVRPYSAIRHAHSMLQKEMSTLERTCGQKRINELQDNALQEELLLEANSGVFHYAATYASFMSVIEQWIPDQTEYRDVLGLVAERFGLNVVLRDFWKDMHVYTLNDPSPFDGIAGAVGAGYWLRCSKARLIRNGKQSWSEGSRAFLESIVGDHVDVIASAHALIELANMELKLICLAHVGEVDQAVAVLVELLQSRGIGNGLACVHFPKDASLDTPISMETLPMQEFVNLMDEVQEAEALLLPRAT